MNGRALRAAVIGLGMGRHHLAAYRSIPNLEVALICDTDADKLRATAREFGGPATTADWRDVACDRSIDLVSICTPDRQHFEQALAMVLAGKHVMCEKPMVTALPDARVLIRSVRGMGVTFAVGNVNRFVPQFALVARYAREGRLGDLFLVASDYIHDMRLVFARTPWRIDPEQPQSAIFGGGVHPVDLSRWVAGEVVEVFAYGNHKAVPEYRSQDNLLIALKFASGCLGKVWITFGIRRRPEHVVNLNAFGSEGSLYSDSERPEARLYLAGVAEGQHGWATIPFAPLAGHPVLAELTHFADCIRTGQTPLVDVAEGARTIAVLDAAQRSLEVGQPVRVEDVARGFTNDEQLLMCKEGFEGLSDVALPEGYALRTYRPGDERAWLDLCSPAIGLDWTEDELHEKLFAVPWFSPERLFFVVHAGEPVGTACAWQQTAGEARAGYVHMVAVRPEHRGRGLGRAMMLRVLRYFREHGFRQSLLHTDDFRLPAIGLYLSLGFEPVIHDEGKRQRWEAVKVAMGVE